MSDKVAEKAWHDFYRQPEFDGVDVAALSKAFLAGRASRDAEVVELADAAADLLIRAGEAEGQNAELREQLAAAESTIESVRLVYVCRDHGGAADQCLECCVQGLLAETPPAVLAARDAEKWDEGVTAERNHWVGPAGNPVPVNPYRGEKP